MKAWATRVVPVKRSRAVRAPRGLADPRQHRDEPALRSDVLDHCPGRPSRTAGGRASGRGRGPGPPYDGGTWHRHDRAASAPWPGHCLRRRRPGRHPLHPSSSSPWPGGRPGREPGRVIVPALVIFGLDAVQSTVFTEIAVDHLGLESLAGVVRLRGLDPRADLLQRHARAPGGLGRAQRDTPAVSQVLRTLPWVRLLVAEVVLVLIGAAAALCVVVPGLVVGHAVRPGRAR